jgi:hypothetical protein
MRYGQIYLPDSPVVTFRLGFTSHVSRCGKQGQLLPDCNFAHLFHKAKGPPGNRATLSMGGSSNGGKAIRTLWCKSRCGSHRCQESFQKIERTALSITYGIFFENLRFSPAFYRTLASPENQTFHPLDPILCLTNRIVAPYSACPGASSEIPAPYTPAFPAALGMPPAHRPGTAPEAPLPASARRRGSQSG